MNVLWAPWRAKYISETSKAKQDECLFCRVIKEENDEQNYVVYRGKHAFIILNAFPYNTAHVMVVPYRHIPSIELLSNDEALDIFNLTSVAIKAIREIYTPDGFNIGVNIGRVAGAGIEAHMHVHIVPRWNGDSNFMPVIFNTKVMPETLGDTFKKLNAKINEIMKKPSKSE
ncbi:HIT domain-containing protein [Sulfolobus sp. E5-1-F]|uniref:HIT family protein n=1 Tax=Saccharolobus sp. E5-1-F TaxID=2663019 RepID=UPI0012981456|nr:HIT domain-containing protein [Sulfolobus sp. E5-1-F]QGA54950.1 HIT domain-containing protein [Sulfolobus sp. E5-1-F]